jgi:hypothetical protein
MDTHQLLAAWIKKWASDNQLFDRLAEKSVSNWHMLTNDELSITVAALESNISFFTCDCSQLFNKLKNELDYRLRATNAKMNFCS